MNLLISRFQNWHTKPYTMSHGKIVESKKFIGDLINGDSNTIERSKENQTFHGNDDKFSINSHQVLETKVTIKNFVA